jgi:hypothetical protein
MGEIGQLYISRTMAKYKATKIIEEIQNKGGKYFLIFNNTKTTAAG